MHGFFKLNSSKVSQVTKAAPTMFVECDLKQENFSIVIVVVCSTFLPHYYAELT